MISAALPSGVSPKIFGFCAELAEKKPRCRVPLRIDEADEALLRQLVLATLGELHLGRDLGLQLAHRLVLVQRQVLDRAAGAAGR